MRDLELRYLTEQVMPADAVEPFGAYLFRGDEPGAELGRHVERAVFLEAFGNTPELLAEEYGPYEASSVFICVVDQIRKLPVGVMRVLLPSARGVQEPDDFETVWGNPAPPLVARSGVAFDPDRTWDIATLAVAAEYRGAATRGLVSMGLYQTLTLTARRSGIDWFVAILDLPVFRMIRWKLRMIFAGYEGVGAQPYLGSAASMPAGATWSTPNVTWRPPTATCTPSSCRASDSKRRCARSTSPAPTSWSGWRRTVAAGQ